MMGSSCLVAMGRQTARLGPGNTLGPPCQDTSRWLTFARIEADLLSTTLEVQTCSNLYKTLQHQKDSWQSTPHVCFLFFTDFISFLFFSWSKDPLSPPHTPKHQATIKPSSIPKKNLQNHTSFHSPPKKSLPPPPEIQHVNGKPLSLLGDTSYMVVFPLLS